MRQLLTIILTLITLDSFSQDFEIITSDKSFVKVKILDDKTKRQLLTEFNWIQENDLRKKLTARTYRLSDNRLIIEFYDRQGIIVNNLEDFKKLEDVTFVKNTVWNLKKNISYKIELPYEEGVEIVKKEKPKRLPEFKSELPQYSNFEVYQLSTNQILFVYKSDLSKYSAIYRDIKTLSSENSTVNEQYYGLHDEEHPMNLLASGDDLSDYEPNEHLVYPKFVKRIIQSHKLSLIEQNVFVDNNLFYGNLYSSEKGYFVMIDEENQKNGAGDKMGILTLRIYPTLEKVRIAQKKYEQFKNKTPQPEHFYQEVSDKYGEHFPEHVLSLIDSLPIILNFDKEQLTLDDKGLEIIDEALKWNGTNFSLFDKWFPCVLAYYGQFFIAHKSKGKWTVKFDSENKVWIPEILLDDNTSAFDSNDFYKSMYEGSIPMKWAGDFDQHRKKWR
jgi:hypothetical protein